MRLFEPGMLCFKIPNTGSTRESFGLVELLSIYQTEEEELVQGYLEISELLFQWKDIKSCFRALFPKLCLEGYWTESSSLANLRWPSSLASKRIDLTACPFSTDTHLTRLS